MQIGQYNCCHAVAGVCANMQRLVYLTDNRQGVAHPVLSDVLGGDAAFFVKFFVIIF